MSQAPPPDEWIGNPPSNFFEVTIPRFIENSVRVCNRLIEWLKRHDNEAMQTQVRKSVPLEVEAKSASKICAADSELVRPSLNETAESILKAMLKAGATDRPKRLNADAIGNACKPPIESGTVRSHMSKILVPEYVVSLRAAGNSGYWLTLLGIENAEKQLKTKTN